MISKAAGHSKSNECSQTDWCSRKVSGRCYGKTKLSHYWPTTDDISRFPTLVTTFITAAVEVDTLLEINESGI